MKQLFIFDALQQSNTLTKALPF